jgi:hypothetical protein
MTFSQWWDSRVASMVATLESRAKLDAMILATCRAFAECAWNTALAQAGRVMVAAAECHTAEASDPDGDLGDRLKASVLAQNVSALGKKLLSLATVGNPP